MEKKEAFKAFVKENPILLKHVQNGNKSWQDFFEIYDIYGDKNEVWNEYLNPVRSTNINNNFDFATLIKSVDLDSIQNGVNSLQRVLGLVQDMSSNKNKEPASKPRPIYKHFED